jgi:hypothetical protein
MKLLTQEFTEMIRSIFLPYLKEQGFSCQGIKNYRRFQKPFIHCVNLQARSDGKAICVNMGVHLDFLPVSGRLEIPSVDEIKEINCCIRTRLSPMGQSDCWWVADPAMNQVELIKQLFQEQGIAFFEKFRLFPDVFGLVTIEDIESGNTMKVFPGKTRVGMAMLLARVNDHIGQKEKSIQFAQYGLRNVGLGHPQSGKGLIKPFREIIDRNS